jgi:hypothetical protein
MVVPLHAEMRHAAGFSSSVEVVASTTMESSGFNSGDDICAAAWERQGVRLPRPMGVCHPEKKIAFITDGTGVCRPANREALWQLIVYRSAHGSWQQREAQ